MSTKLIRQVLLCAIVGPCIAFITAASLVIFTPILVLFEFLQEGSVDWRAAGRESVAMLTDFASDVRAVK